MFKDVGPVASRDAQGTLFADVCQRLVLAAAPLLQVIEPALQHQRAAALAWPSWSWSYGWGRGEAPPTSLPPHPPAVPGQSEESAEGWGSMSYPHKEANPWLYGSGGRWEEWGPGTGGHRPPAQQLLTLPMSYAHPQRT